MFPKWITPEELLDQLLDQFDSQNDLAVQLRIGNLLIQWASCHWEDFESPKMKFTLNVFLEMCARKSFTSICQKLCYIVTFAMEKPNECFIIAPNTDMNVLSLSSEEIAQTLTVMEWHSFTKIKSRHLLRHIWPCFGSEQTFISQNIQHFNHISSWITSMVLSFEKSKLREKCLCKFMSLVILLRQYNNFNTLLAVIAGLNCSAILRLKHSNRYLSKSDTKKYLMIVQEMSSEKTFANYRQAIRQSTLPCIPYIGLLLRDLVYLDETHTKMNNQIHIGTMAALGDVLLMLETYQSHPYSFHSLADLESFIRHYPVLINEQAYDRSYTIEPRH